MRKLNLIKHALNEIIMLSYSEQKINLEKSLEMIVVVLEIQPHDEENYMKYNAFTVNEKLNKILASILSIYQQIEQLHPDTNHIIFTWREYGIFDPFRRSVSKDTNIKLIQKEFLKLTKLCPKLIIISGPLLIRKTIETNEEEAKKIKQYYEAVKGIEQLNDEEIQHKKYRPTKKEIINVYKNSTYVFYDDKIVSEHGKVALFNETKQEPDKETAWLQPGKGDNLKQFIVLPNGKVTSIQTCRDLDVRPLPFQVDIQFVLSSTISLNYDHLNARIVTVHADAIHPTAYVCPRGSVSSKNKIHVYRYSFLDDSPALTKAKKLVPFQYILKDLLFYYMARYTHVPYYEKIILEINNIYKKLDRVQFEKLNEVKKIKNKLSKIKDRLLQENDHSSPNENVINTLMLQIKDVNVLLKSLYYCATQYPYLNNKKLYCLFHQPPNLSSINTVVNSKKRKNFFH